MRHPFQTTVLALALNLVPVILACAACDGTPLGAADPAPTAAAGDVASAAAMDGNGEFRAREAAMPFDDAEVFFEFNTTDNDLGLQVFLDAEDWRRVRVTDADGKDIVDIRTGHALSELGITELRFESAEPSPAEVLDLFGPGVYTFTGRTVDGQGLESTAALSHQFATAPVFAPSGGETVDPTATVVTWTAPGAEYVEIIIESLANGEVLDVIVSASRTRLDVPPQFLASGTEYKIEILSIAPNGNKTITESAFVTS